MMFSNPKANRNRPASIRGILVTIIVIILKEDPIPINTYITELQY